MVNFIKFLLYFVVIVVFSENLFAQKTTHFDSKLVYQYQSEEGGENEFSIFYNSKTQAILFDKTQTFSEIFDMEDYVVAENGIFYIVGKQEHGANYKDIVKTMKTDILNKKPFVYDQNYITKINLHQEFSVPKHIDVKNKKIAKSYLVTFKNMQNSYMILHTTEVSYNTYPIYFFNQLKIESKLPPVFSGLEDIVANNELITQLIYVYNTSDVNGNNQIKMQTLSLKYWGATTFYTYN